MIVFAAIVLASLFPFSCLRNRVRLFVASIRNPHNGNELLAQDLEQPVEPTTAPEISTFATEIACNVLYDAENADALMNQKFALVKQYLWPTMIYDLQMAPLGSNIVRDLSTMDDVMELFAFSCLHLPSNAPTGFFFASRSSGGLAMPKPTEECAIQQINSTVLLNNSTDVYVKEFRKPSQDRRMASLDTR